MRDVKNVVQEFNAKSIYAFCCKHCFDHLPATGYKLPFDLFLLPATQLSPALVNRSDAAEPLG